MLSGRRKLLLADDSPTIRKVISLTFGDEGLEVVAVGDGESALRALAQEPPPDILLADVVMPGPDGYALCERVKRDGRLGTSPSFSSSARLNHSTKRRRAELARIQS